MAEPTGILEGLKLAQTISEGGGLGRSIAAGTFLSFVCVVELTWEYSKTASGERPNYMAPIKKVLLYYVFLTGYELFASAIIDTVMRLGTLDQAENEAFLNRTATFKNHIRLQAEENAELSALVNGYILEPLMQSAVWISYAIAAVSITVFKAIQKVGLEVALAIGPFMIAASALPGPMKGFLGSWVLALVELGLWGFIARTTVALLDTGTKAVFDIGLFTMDTAPNYIQHFIWNGMYVAALFSIPSLASLLVRGQATSGMAEAAAAGVKTVGVGMAAEAHKGAFAVGDAAGGAIASVRGGGAADVAGAATGAVSAAARPSDSVKPPTPSGR